ncbi:hypothetical protein NQ318_022190 [Aromia moschata]|uniref:Uncharacterized protein n=1 Tax=Aromia moschata TaxID=1265417 RepID=A0AAV8Z7V8_9CUCU|nr:hypothetical protein NQ318_022190 [Aromia moschata]
MNEMDVNIHFKGGGSIVTHRPVFSDDGDYYNYDYHHCLVACSESGKVMVWKVVTHYKILEQKLPVQKLFTFNIIPSDKEDDLKALVSYKNKKYISFAEVDIKKEGSTRLQY